MKVLKEGKNKHWTEVVTCDASGEVAHGTPRYNRAGCESELEINQDDIMIASKKDSSYQGEYDVTIYVVECPRCNQWIEVNDIPPFVRQYITKAAPGFRLGKDT